MYITTIDASYHEDIIIFNGYSNDYNTSVLNAIKEYLKGYHNGYLKLRLYSIIHDKETLDDKEVAEILNTIGHRHDISTEECKEKIELDNIYYFHNKCDCFYRDNVLFIIKENKKDTINIGDIIQITEEQSNRIEDTKFATLNTSSLNHNTKLPNWAAKYLCNNTDNEELKKLILSYSDLKFFT
jgi:hypothetical protein